MSISTRDTNANYTPNFPRQQNVFQSNGPRNFKSEELFNINEGHNDFEPIQDDFEDRLIDYNEDLIEADENDEGSSQCKCEGDIVVFGGGHLLGYAGVGHGGGLSWFSVTFAKDCPTVRGLEVERCLHSLVIICTLVCEVRIATPELEKMETRNERVKNKIDILCAEIQEIQLENANLKKENETLKMQNTEFTKRMEIVEKEIQKNKIVVQGIKEMENKSDEIIKENIRKILREINIEINMENETGEVKRIEIKPKNRATPRPILIEFASGNKNREVLKAAKKLKGSEMYMDNGRLQ
ncbi:hypothetical protein FQA39_LY10577 [Lamprigera yunnana]|nr:hypothetical protein FQA39_LY10577 [Lamprigera yunnana]